MAKFTFPNEIWYHIFSYLDEKSLRTIASVCKLFFELVRGNEKLSGCIILRSVFLKDLATKIKNSEWIWERWPSLKTLKIPIVHSEYSDIYFKSNIFTSVYEKEAHKLIQEMKFETCSNLEKVVLFNCCWSVKENSDLKKSFAYEVFHHGHVMEYSFQPKDIPLIISWENTTVINLSDFDAVFASRFGKIEEVAKSLHTLSVRVNYFCILLQEKFNNGDSFMFDGLNRTLKSVELEFRGHVCHGASPMVLFLLKTLGKKCT